MSNHHHARSWALACGLFATLWAASVAVQAREVVWSVGVASPGVQLGVSNAPPMRVHQPVWMQAQPVHWQRPAVIVQPQPVYYAAPQPVYYGQPQVTLQPQPYYRGWGPHHRGHWRHHQRGFDNDRRHEGGGRD